MPHSVLRSDTSLAYFSMEVGLDPALPTYSGGLGVLAGDTLKAAADLRLPLVGMTLLHRKGYFRQHLDAEGNQTEDSVRWSPEDELEVLDPTITVRIEGRPVKVRAWRRTIQGVTGHEVPVYFLDTDLPDNTPGDRSLTDHLYGGDQRYRLSQEIVLGMGGVAMLEALGHGDVQVYHMNEGHSALLALALLERQAGDRALRGILHADREAVRRRCVFTTHTPVPAGHDQFPIDLVREVLGAVGTTALEEAGCVMDGRLNMTYMALVFSRWVNGVSMRHLQVSRGMFPNYPLNSITNGVHAATWTSPPFRRLFDEHLPPWRTDNLYLRHAVSIPLEEILGAHAKAKEELIREISTRAEVTLEPEAFTIGFARRATPYKRADLLFTDLDRLREAAGGRPLQVVYAGKAHPNDGAGKDTIRRIHAAARALADGVRVVYLEDYGMEIASHLVAGVDLWLNTPMKPLEASGTSGMKAALNGVPSLSVLDGWWIEGHGEGVTGWAIGEAWRVESDSSQEADSLYTKLREKIVPLFHDDPSGWAKVMRAAIALNGSFFNAQRMLHQYLRNAYLPPTLS